jgi:hypothetical protein
MLLLIALFCSFDHTGGAAIGGEFGSSYIFLGARICDNDILLIIQMDSQVGSVSRHDSDAACAPEAPAGG